MLRLITNPLATKNPCRNLPNFPFLNPALAQLQSEITDMGVRMPQEHL